MKPDLFQILAQWLAHLTYLSCNERLAKPQYKLMREQPVKSPCHVRKDQQSYVTLLSSLSGAKKEVVLIVTKEVARAFEGTSHRPWGFCMVSLTLQGS